MTKSTRAASPAASGDSGADNASGAAPAVTAESSSPQKKRAPRASSTTKKAPATPRKRTVKSDAAESTAESAPKAPRKAPVKAPAKASEKAPQEGTAETAGESAAPARKAPARKSTAKSATAKAAGSTAKTAESAEKASPAKRAPRKSTKKAESAAETAAPQSAPEKAVTESPAQAKAPVESPAPAVAERATDNSRPGNSADSQNASSEARGESSEARTGQGESAPARKRTRRGGRRSRKNNQSDTANGQNVQNGAEAAVAVAGIGASDAASDETSSDAAHSAPEDGAAKADSASKGGRGRGGRGSGKSGAKAEKDADKATAEEQQDKKGAAKSAAKPAQKSGKSGPAPKRRMFMSVLPGEQVEVALAENGRLTEYYVEMSHQAKTKSNIYKGVINNVDANLQAAFVNYGAEKNGFLQIDEVHPEYYLTPHDSTRGKKYPPIQKVLKAGQEVLVQVVKEPTGSKGAFLTTFLSLAGRFLVLTPGKEQSGVSRKVEDDEERARLREMLSGINAGPGLGVIVRTVSAGTSKTTIQRDLQFLKRLWKDVRKRGMEEKAPAIIHQEPGLAQRAVRDYLSDDIQEVWVDDQQTADHVQEYANLLFPRKAGLVNVHTTDQSLWDRFGLTKQLDQIYSREVVLPSGGRLVFDQTEALMAIDINSGKISGKTNFESMALRTNMEAAEAIALHLKLRDIGGQIVIDFIEMRDSNHVREVEKTMRNAMKNDRARHDVGRISRFGLMEVVRQRTAFSALSISTEPCPHCKGLGTRRNMEWQAQQALRDLRRQLISSKAAEHTFRVDPELAMYLLNHKRERLLEMESSSGIHIEVAAALEKL